MLAFHIMKTRLLLALVPFAAVSCVSQNPSSIPTADNSNATALFNDVNRYRASVGKRPLVRHAGLDAIAQRHSESMRRSGKLGHDGFQARAEEARTKYQLSPFHENVADGPRGSSITRTWAASRHHAPAMLGSWSCTGVGVAVDGNGKIFATQVFGNISSIWLPRNTGSF